MAEGSGRPHLGGKKRTVTTTAGIEALLPVFMEHTQITNEAKAIRKLIALGIAHWSLNYAPDEDEGGAS